MSMVTPDERPSLETSKFTLDKYIFLEAKFDPQTRVYNESLFRCRFIRGLDRRRSGVYIIMIDWLSALRMREKTGTGLQISSSMLLPNLISRASAWGWVFPQNTPCRKIRNSHECSHPVIRSLYTRGLLSISYYFSKRGSQVCCQLANYVSKFGSWAGTSQFRKFIWKFELRL